MMSGAPGEPPVEVKKKNYLFTKIYFYIRSKFSQLIINRVNKITIVCNIVSEIDYILATLFAKACNGNLKNNNFKLPTGTLEVSFSIKKFV